MTANAQSSTAGGLSLAGLSAGFKQPVEQSQQVFRQVLAALAEPGTIQQLPDQASPVGLHSAAYQVCLALLDQETRLWIEPALRTEAIESSLRFHCGCPLVEAPEQAAFALIRADSSAEWPRFALGSHEYPDRSTTVIIQTDGLDQGDTLVLRGPGIARQRQVSIAGFDGRWQARLADNQAAFPCGTDFLFTAGSVLMGLPRTTQVSITRAEG